MAKSSRGNGEAERLIRQYGRQVLLLTPLEGKRPLKPAWQRKALERFENGHDVEAYAGEMGRHLAGGDNVGMATQKGMVVLDADDRPTVEYLIKHCPKAPRQNTANGAHFFFQLPEGVVLKNSTAVELAEGVSVDVRAEGAQVVVWPSVHASGIAYSWTIRLPEDLGDVPELPKDILKRLPRKGQRQQPALRIKKKRATEGDVLLEGERNRRLFEDACAMRRRGFSEDEIRVALLRSNKRRCHPSLPRADVLTIARQAAGYAPASLGENLTDVGNGKRFATQHGRDVRYCFETDQWFVWRGGRWDPAAKAKLEKRLKETAKAIWREAATEPDPDRRKALASWAARSEGAQRLKAMLECARSEPEIVVEGEKLDSNPWLLGCENGTVDLRAGKLRPARRSDLITKSTGVVYDPKARLSLWDSTLRRALPDAGVRRFLQKCVGYAATGAAREDILLVAYGGTRTAKGTVEEACAKALGEYASSAGMEDLAERRRATGGGARPELARLRGTRLVSIYETGAALKLDAALVKSLAGSDPVTVRTLYREPFTFVPQFLLWIATNARPSLPAEDNAVWERLREVPFGVHIPEGERDPSVRRRLADPKVGGPAVLRWIVAGCLMWQAEGLKPPAAVRRAGKEYRLEMDPLAAFLDERCRLGPDKEATAEDLRTAYTWFVAKRNEKALGPKRFAAALRAHGCELGWVNSKRGWKGVAVVPKLPKKGATPRFGPQKNGDG